MSAPQSNPLRYVNAKAAREQACEAVGFMASVLIELGDGTTIEIPNSAVLDPEQQARYDQLEFECESLDRWPDPVNEDGTPKLGDNGYPLQGAVRVPHRVNKVLVENYETRLAKAILGEDYDRAIAAGFYPSQLGIHWMQLREQVKAREAADPKSVGSVSPVDAVPETD